MVPRIRVSEAGWKVRTLQAASLVLATVMAVAISAEDVPPDDPSRVLVTGEIVDEQGRPQPNVTAEVVAHFESLSVRSDAQGRIALRFPGPWIEEGLVLCRSGELLGMADLEDADQDGLPQPFRMVLKPKRVVTFTVKAGDGSGVPEARVIAYHGNSDVATALTDAAGELRLDVPADARITKVVAFKSGAGFDYRTVATDGFQKPIGSLEPLSEPVTLTLGGALKPRTVVVTDPSNTPVPGLRVALHEILKPEQGHRIVLRDNRWLSGVTNAKGEVQFDALPSDTRCHIRFRFVSDRWLGHGTSTYPADPVNTIKALVEPMRTLSGKVVDGEGKPVPGASIQTRSRMSRPERFSQGRARTRDDGRFQLEVPRGEGRVSLLIRSGSSSMNAAADFDGDENLEIGDQLVVEPLATIRGDVRTPDGKAFVPERPLAANIFSRSGWSYFPRTDEKGQYSIRLPAGDYSLSMASQREPFLLTAGENRVLNLQIQPQEIARPAKSPLQGVVRRPDGMPVGKARLLHHGGLPRFSRMDLMADAAGEFRYERDSGPAILYATSPTGDFAAYKELDATQQQVDVELSPTATVVGRILNSESQPISGVQVNLMLQFPVESWKGSFTNTFDLGGSTDKEGRFRIIGVPVGTRVMVNVHMKAGPDRGGNSREGVPIDKAGDFAIPDTVVRTDAAQ